MRVHLHRHRRRRVIETYIWKCCSFIWTKKRVQNVATISWLISMWCKRFFRLVSAKFKSNAQHRHRADGTTYSMHPLIHRAPIELDPFVVSNFNASNPSGKKLQINKIAQNALAVSEQMADYFNYFANSLILFYIWLPKGSTTLIIIWIARSAYKSRIFSAPIHNSAVWKRKLCGPNLLAGAFNVNLNTILAFYCVAIASNENSCEKYSICVNLAIKIRCSNRIEMEKKIFFT